MNQLADIGFGTMDWEVGLTGDLGTVAGIESFRGLVNRWLLTTPAEDPSGLTEEETERRRQFEDAAARESDYYEPEGAGMLGCLPWDPTWGLGVKRFAGRTLTPELIAQARQRVRDGLRTLQGVRRVIDVTVAGAGNQLTIGWKLETDFGAIGGQTEIN